MIKMKSGISRANLSKTPDAEHTHCVFFEKGQTTCLGYFQNPPPPVRLATEHFQSHGMDPKTIERLYATRDRWREMSSEVYAEEIAASAAQRATDVADAKQVGLAWLQILKAQDPSITRARLVNFVRWLNEADVFNGGA